MRAELLEIYGFDFIDIQEFYSELLPNKHGKAVIGGTIRGDKKEEYLSSGGKVTQIIAKTYEGNTKEKCLINILKLYVLLGKQLPIMTKINCLIAALTRKALTNFDLFEAEDISRQESKDATMTGIEMLENLIAPVVDSVDYKVEIQSGDIRIDIDKTLYVDKNGEVNISKLFTTIL